MFLTQRCSPLPPQIYLRFLDYEMQNSNECKKNFVAVYDGSSSVEDLKAKFCSTVANDVMLRTGLGVIRMWADEGSRNSHFQMLFTSFQERKAPSHLSACQLGTQLPRALPCLLPAEQALPGVPRAALEVLRAVLSLSVRCLR